MRAFFILSFIVVKGLQESSILWSDGADIIKVVDLVLCDVGKSACDLDYSWKVMGGSAGICYSDIY